MEDTLGWSDIRADRLYDKAAVGALFGVCVRTVERWAKRGKLAPVRTPGGEARFKGADLLAWYGEGRSVQPAPTETRAGRDRRVRSELAEIDRLMRATA